MNFGFYQDIVGLLIAFGSIKMKNNRIF